MGGAARSDSIIADQVPETANLKAGKTINACPNKAFPDLAKFAEIGKRLRRKAKYQ
jgi:hypothetical protein